MEATIVPVEIKDYNNYHQALQHMLDQGVRHLGWVNAGIYVPKHYNFVKAFANRSGTSCLYVDLQYRVAYSVDMGD